MYLPDYYSMRSTTLSNYYLIDWWRNFDFCLFVCWIDIRFCYSYMTWETGGLELASTIILVLQANRLTKCARYPKDVLSLVSDFKSIFQGEKVTHFFYLHLMHCFCMNESKKWDQLTISFSIQKILLRPLQLLVEKNSLNKYFVWI